MLYYFELQCYTSDTSLPIAVYYVPIFCSTLFQYSSDNIRMMRNREHRGTALTIDSPSSALLILRAPEAAI
jgi:hypothetical protein